jgi:hypothetical protein
VSIDEYLRRVGAQLAGLGPVATRSLAEIRDHLHDSVEDRIERGATPDEAERDAIEQFGDPLVVATELAAVLRHEGDPVERIFKIISITNLFVAIWGLAAVALLNPNAELLTATGLIAAAAIAGAVTSIKRSVDSGVLVIAGVGLAAVGIAGVLWALIGHRSSGAEVGLALLTGLYLVQGALSIWAGARRHGLATELQTA